MYPDESKAVNKSALGTFVFDKPDFSSPDLILAVTTEIEFSIDWSKWRLISGGRDEWSLHTNGDCRFLVGELVVLDLTKRILVPCFRRELRFRIVEASGISDTP
jgi:hypothetical protein